MVEADEPGLRPELAGRLDGVAEQMIGAREARIAGIHHGRRNAGETQRPACAYDLARERMRRILRLRAPRRCRHIDQNAADPEIHREGRVAILLDTGLACDAPTCTFSCLPI